MSGRLISHSEATTALDCQAKHDFAYVGKLAGTALRPRDTAPLLRRGRAWGSGVATYHQLDRGTDPSYAKQQILVAMNNALEEDAEAQKAAGLYIPEDHEAMFNDLEMLMTHYVSTTEHLYIERPEHQVLVPIPRTGRRRRFRRRVSPDIFEAYLDGIHVDDEGRYWIVEYKLRGRLSSLEQLAKSPQHRRYAWAWREIHGIDVTGVIADERLAEIPRPARWVQEKRKGEGIDGKVPSHAKDQLCTPEAYLEACEQANVEPVPETEASLRSRRWQQRERIFFRRGELNEAEEELRSIAKQLHQLDRGEIYPVRNPSQMRCPSCQFNEICNEPTDFDLVAALFKRVPAKRNRKELVA
jgi:hypothetical protein